MEAQENDRQTAQLNSIEALLRQEDALSLAGSLGKLLMGLGVLAAVGIIVTTLLTFVLYTWFDTSWIGWLGWFLVYLLILTPLLVWYERQSRHDYFIDSARTIDPPSSYGEYPLGQLSTGIGAAASALLWGPRALVDGIRGLRGQHAPGQRAVIDRAARLTFDLYGTNGGVRITEILHPPEPMQTFALAVDLLDKHGWIGKSSDGKSLWLDSTWRPKVRIAIER